MPSGMAAAKAELIRLPDAALATRLLALAGRVDDPRLVEELDFTLGEALERWAPGALLEARETELREDFAEDPEQAAAEIEALHEETRDREAARILHRAFGDGGHRAS